MQQAKNVNILSIFYDQILSIYPKIAIQQHYEVYIFYEPIFSGSKNF